MNDETLITLGRMMCGSSILLTHMITGANSSFVLLGIFLLGVPIELASHVTKKETEE